MAKALAKNRNDDTLLGRAEAVRRDVSNLLDSERRSEMGQFMTPASVAEFMASLFGELPDELNLLDAGAGFGALTAAFVHECCRRGRRPNAIHVTAYELEPDLLSALRQTMSACAEECRSANIVFEFEIISEDYIHAVAGPLLSERKKTHLYDFAILNPPYAKIRNVSEARKALRTVGIETSNLYTAFVALALSQLKENGELVAITPRSFCNGPYFQPFRERLLSQSRLRRIHVYNSRKTAFRDDAVLQENIIFHAVRTSKEARTITISSSEGPDHPVTHREVAYQEIIRNDDPNQFIRVVASDEDSMLGEKVRGLKCTLRDLGLTVSTGRVVDFRVREHLRADPAKDTVPLIYAGHFTDGFVEWPRPQSKKPNAIVKCGDTDDLLVPSGNYVLTKRFTSKEERRRLVAAVFDPEVVRADKVGFENHLNYFHKNGQGLPRVLALGLAVYLNSTAVDHYFRQFSGHTQVNATDLRHIHYPSVVELEQLGARVNGTMPSQEIIDEMVTAIF